MKESRFVRLFKGHKASVAPLVLLSLVALAVLAPHEGFAQEEPDEPDTPDPPANPLTPPAPPQGSGNATNFGGNLQIVKAPGKTPSSSPSGLGDIDIFPLARQSAMGVRNMDAVPFERARRGGRWLCQSKGSCSAKPGTAGETREGNGILKSIKVRTPAMPVPVTIWRRVGRQDSNGISTWDNGKLDFDPGMLAQWNYTHLCSYPAVESADPAAPVKKLADIQRCVDGEPGDHRPDQGEILLGFEWPRQAELAGFKYLAIRDSCGNALVYPFQRSFVVPALDITSGGCNGADGRVLRVFPSGTFVTVTAFNLEATASDDVVQVSYRVAVPPLENYSQAEPAKLLYPDFKLNELVVDCGPQRSKGPTDKNGKPIGPGVDTFRPVKKPTWTPITPEPEPTPTPKQPPKPPEPPVPGEEPVIDPATGERLVPDDPGGGPGAPPAPPQGPPPLNAKSDGDPSGGGPPKGPSAPGMQAGMPGGAPGMPSGAGPGGPGGPKGGPGGPKPDKAGPVEEDSVGPKTLNHGTVVIAPEALREGNCRIEWTATNRGRLGVPLALRVQLIRTDVTGEKGEGIPLIAEEDGQWIVTANDYTYTLPALGDKINGNSRLKLIVQSDPFNTNGKVVLVGDAGRVAVIMHERDVVAERDVKQAARRTIGSTTIHTVPLCGENNFETLEAAGSCIRGYLTIPAMLATLQITRAPWIEKPLITRSILSAVGVAFAFDSYDPVTRSAFPVAGQVGGFVQNLDESRIGLMAYAGVAPTLPILGEGGNTTSFGFLAGMGMSYITNSNGPDEGFKPTAFISVVVQVGQANPSIQSGPTTSSVSGTYSAR